MSSSQHDHPELPPPWVTEVADGIFAYVQPDGSWWINNTGFIRGDRTVVSIDTCSTERRTRAYLAKVDEIAGQVPRILSTPTTTVTTRTATAFFPSRRSSATNDAAKRS